MKGNDFSNAGFSTAKRLVWVLGFGCVFALAMILRFEIDRSRPESGAPYPQSVAFSPPAEKGPVEALWLLGAGIVGMAGIGRDRQR